MPTAQKTFSVLMLALLFFLGTATAAAAGDHHHLNMARDPVPASCIPTTCTLPTATVTLCVPTAASFSPAAPA